MPLCQCWMSRACMMGFYSGQFQCSHASCLGGKVWADKKAGRVLSFWSGQVIVRFPDPHYVVSRGTWLGKSRLGEGWLKIRDQQDHWSSRLGKVLVKIIGRGLEKYWLTGDPTNEPRIACQSWFCCIKSQERKIIFVNPLRENSVWRLTILALLVIVAIP